MSKPIVQNAQNHETEASDDVDVNDQHEPHEEVLNEVSQRLVEARVALGLSEEDIAGKLFLSPARIRHIDTGRFDKIGKPAFLRGYIRSYAREVGLSPDGMIALLNGQDKNPAAPEEKLSRVTEHRSHTINTTPAATTAIIGIVGVILVLLLIWWFNPEKQESAGVFPDLVGLSDDEQQVQADRDLPDTIDQEDGNVAIDSDPMKTPGSAELQSARIAPGAMANATESTPDQTRVFVSETVNSALVVESDLKPGDDNDIAAVAGQDELAGDVTKAGSKDIQISRHEEGEWRVVTVSANGEDHLKFTFTDDCWLEVVDALGTPVYGDLNHERERLSVFGNAPFKVLIGRVSAVTVSLNEKPVDLQAYAFNDTAKLVIE